MTIDGDQSGAAPAPTLEPVVSAAGDGLVAALTFDDGPNGGDTSELLDFLAARSIRAVFCVVGEQILRGDGAALLRRIRDDGHVLANHSTGFADMGDWTPDAIRDDLVANLAIIREALGDPAAPVPYFRAPNGSWGRSAEVAVKLGMQPLGVVGAIGDWLTQDEGTLTVALRRAMTPGGVVLVHDGGGDRRGSIRAVRTVVDERLAEGWRFTLPGR